MNALHGVLEKCRDDRMAADRPRFSRADCVLIDGYARHPPQGQAISMKCVWAATQYWHTTKLHG